MSSSLRSVPSPSSSRRLLGLAGSLLAALALPPSDRAHAAEVTVQNDSVTDFAQVAIQAGFAANERGAAWLTSPCEGDIVAVQVFWRSQFGSVGSQLGDSITVSQAGTFPVPGAPLAVLVGPLMQDGFLNEFRFLDEAGTIPLQVPVTTGQGFVVDFRFFDPPPILGPSLVTDIDGCQAGKNGIFAIPPSSWFSSCALGVSGDFVIRAVVDCADVAPVPIFSDGFESGDTSAWTSTVP